ncbi:M6 metalloprotease [Periconia macrospinosa]|uniref:M6 metalloprotease n=1 Tax=Periconia macrospinosa TaxID=97972 RepID=A0A2V1DHY2_9PLEO|nr:M6 metalloprotease [Periconia macrospinosa]
MYRMQRSVLTGLLAAVSIFDLTVAQACRPLPRLGGSRAPTTGVLRAAAIFVDFPDFAAQSSTTDHWNTFTNASELFKTMSFGKLDLQMKPQLEKFYRMPGNSSSYNYKRGLTTEDHLRYVNDALKAVGTAVSFTGINVLYVVAAKGATEISFSPTLMVTVTAADGTVIGNSVTYGQDAYNTWGYKVVNHETGHTMGLPDLYPYSGGTTTQWVGGFDMMGLISGQSPDYFGILKWQLGWVTNTQVDCVNTTGTSTHRISPIEVQGGTKKLVMVPLSSTQSVIAEVRSNQGADKDACATGVLIYEARSDIASGNGPIRVMDSKPGSAGCSPSIGGGLNDAPYQVGSTYSNGSGLSITVKSKEGEDYVVEVRR